MDPRVCVQTAVASAQSRGWDWLEGELRRGGEAVYPTDVACAVLAAADWGAVDDASGRGGGLHRGWRLAEAVCFPPTTAPAAIPPSVQVVREALALANRAAARWPLQADAR
jgi:hypothetical protein